MTHIFETPMGDKKNLAYALSSIPGVGTQSAMEVCQGLGYSPQGRWEDLSNAQRQRLRDWMTAYLQSKGRLAGFDYRRARQRRKDDLIKLGSLRGIRLRMGLPVRGQRTRTNARTARRASRR